MALLDIEAGFWSIRRQIEALVGAKLTNSVLQQSGANGGASFAQSLGITSNASEQGSLFETCVKAYQTAGFGKFEISEAQWPIGKVIIQAQNTFESWMMRQHNQKVNSPICAYTAGVLVGFINVISNRQDIACVEHSCQALGDESCVFELLPVSQARDREVVAFNPDPKLGRQVNLLETLFERMPMGIAIIDREYRIQRYNPTWKAFSALYAPPSASPLVPGVYYFDHLPGSEEIVIPLFERILAGEDIHQNGLKFESGGIVSFWDVVLAPIMENGEVSGILNATIDVTERVLLQQNLEQRVEERTHQLKTLLQVSQDIASTLTLEPLLDLILEQLRTIVDYTGTSILILEGETLVMGAYRGPIPRHKAQRMRFPLDEAPVNRQVIRQREPLIIPDIRDDTPMAKMFRQTAGGELESTLGYVRSWLGVPLMIKGEILGMLTLDHSQPGFFTAHHADLILALANQVAIAIENARLYAQAEDMAIATERSRLARDLHDSVTQTLFSASLIADVLPRLWERKPEEGRRRLEELRQLTRGALAEMRTLLMELRPSALVEVGLGDLLRQLGEAFTGRSRIPIQLKIEGNAPISPDVKVGLYRIAQEALNNIAKHAGATQVNLNLHSQPDGLELTIADNGCGFDPASISAEHLGLKIMNERSKEIGVRLTVNSQIGIGTIITARLEN